jgi:hypothetical protein
MAHSAHWPKCCAPGGTVAACPPEGIRGATGAPLTTEVPA